MSASEKRPMSRRDFLNLSMAAGFSAWLASCAPKAAETGELPITMSMDDLIAGATKEGELTTIALPHDWANYGEIIETFKSKYSLKVNELNPDAGSADELAAIEANKESRGPQAPDVIDIGVGHTANAMTKGLVAAYKVAMAGDVLKSNESVQTVFAAGLSRSGGDIEKAPEMGLQFWKEMNDAGNFIPVIADLGPISQGETPLAIQWDYLCLANRDKLAGNPEIEVVVPKTGVIAGPYAGGISAYAPHPYAARLWWEFVMSDEGQLLYLKGYAHPIRYTDMAARGVIPEDLAAKLPPAEAYEKAFFPTIQQLTDSHKII